MRKQSLHSDWTFQQINNSVSYHQPQLKPVPPLPATIPGNIHLDLVNAGIIDHPFKRLNEIGVQWVDRADWQFDTKFMVDKGPASRHVLRFEGLDTVATILLNGQAIGTHDSFFTPLELNVSDLILDGENELSVQLLSAVNVGAERREAYFKKHGKPQNFVMFDERAFVRKPGYMSGWDWGPRLVGCGIFGQVSLDSFENRIESFDVKVEPSDDGWFLVTASATSTDGSEVILTVNPHSHETDIEKVSPSSWRLKGELWWPVGYGAQPLHSVTATVGSESVTKKFGLRTIKLLREADQVGESFEFEVNGLKIWARGANWIPNDSFPSQIGSDDLRSQVRRAVELNMNMLRVWGGGMYESEAFYDACDEMGVLVWQDFPFGCMYYPDDEEWQDTIYKEASFHVKRLAHRASLALWCGNNENLVMWQTKWGGTGIQPDRYYGENHYEGSLKRAVEDFNPNCSYIASSPIGMSPDESEPVGPERNAGMGRYGDSHYWDVWHGRGDWKFYRDSDTRFSSEFGFASSCSLEQWQEILKGRDWESFPSAAVLHHDKTGKAWATFLGYVTAHYPEPKSVEDWVYYSQLNQRDALVCGIEHYRRFEPCGGSLIWQFNDCWPVTSWAVQDYSRRLKPAGFELERLYAPVTISLDYLVGFETAGYWLVNDSTETVEVDFTVTAIDTTTGNIIQEWNQHVKLAADSRELALSLPLSGLNRSQTALRARLGTEASTDRWQLLVDPKDCKFGAPSMSVESAEGKLLLHVNGFVADLVVWDQSGSASINSATVNQPGWQPKWAANETLSFRVEGEIQSLRIRSLSGNHDIT